MNANNFVIIFHLVSHLKIILEWGMTSSYHSERGFLKPSHFKLVYFLYFDTSFGHIFSYFHITHTHTHTHTYIYIYIYICMRVTAKTSFIFLFCLCKYNFSFNNTLWTHIHVHINIYIHSGPYSKITLARERERERQTDRQTERSYISIQYKSSFKMVMDGSIFDWLLIPNNKLAIH